MTQKKLLITPILWLLFFSASFLQAAEPFNLRHYGNFKKVVHMRGMNGVADLNTVLSAPHTYAVGAILKNAERYGLNTKKPFPFLIEGPFQDLRWHVINGPNPEFKGHFKGHGGEPPFIQLKENMEQTSGIIIGFYSANIKEVFTHPGESWHLHILIGDEVAVGKGAVLKLPET